ncbi:MAG: hypothetical protein ACJAX4_004856 [Clostridium sp.]|jgi:hypothetical protein
MGLKYMDSKLNKLIILITSFLEFIQRFPSKVNPPLGNIQCMYI